MDDIAIAGLEKVDPLKQDILGAVLGHGNSGADAKINELVEKVNILIDIVTRSRLR